MDRLQLLAYNSIPVIYVQFNELNYTIKIHGCFNLDYFHKTLNQIFMHVSFLLAERLVKFGRRRRHDPVPLFRYPNKQGNLPTVWVWNGRTTIGKKGRQSFYASSSKICVKFYFRSFWRVTDSVSASGTVCTGNSIFHKTLLTLMDG